MKKVKRVDGKKVPIQPVEAEAEAGKKKREKMTLEEILEQQDRMKAVPGEEKRKLVKGFSDRLTRWMYSHGYDRHQGPLSEEELKGNPPDVIFSISYMALWNGDWRWKKDLDLLEQLIIVAKSKMAHIIRKYCNSIRIIATSRLTYNQQIEMEKAAGVADWMEVADELEIECSMRDWAFGKAIKAVSGNLMFLRYLEVLYDVNDYEFMASRLGIEEKEVIKIERKLLKFLSKVVIRPTKAELKKFIK